MAGFISEHGQTAAVPKIAEKTTRNLEWPATQDVPTSESCRQPRSFDQRDRCNSLGDFSNLANLDDFEPNQANSDLWQTLLENSSATFSPRPMSLMPNDFGKDMRADYDSPLMQQLTSVSPYIAAAESANKNDFFLSDIDLDFDFSTSGSPLRQSITARSSSIQSDPNLRRPNRRTSISPLRLGGRRDTREEDSGGRLNPGNETAAFRALGPVTEEDLSAQSIAALLQLLKSLIFPRFDTASQMYEYGSSVLSKKFDPHQCEWLCSKYEELLESYLERSLLAMRKRPRARYQNHTKHGCDFRLDETRPTVEWVDRTQGLSQSTEDTVGTALQTYYLDNYITPMGNVSFDTGKASDDPRDKEGTKPSSVLCISFMPRATGRTTGLCIRLPTEIGGPKITRQIVTFNVIPYSSAIFECVLNKDLQGVQVLFDLRAASPRDVDPTGSSLLWVGISADREASDQADLTCSMLQQQVV